MESHDEQDTSSQHLQQESDRYDEMKADAAQAASTTASTMSSLPNEDEQDGNDESNNFEKNITNSSPASTPIDDNNDTTREVDFHPPQSKASMRLSPTMQKVVVSRNSPSEPSSPSFIFGTNEGTTSTTSPFGSTPVGSPFYTTSSRRGQSSRLRENIISPRSHQAAERAAREATSKYHQNNSDPTHLRRHHPPSTLDDPLRTEGIRSSSPTARRNNRQQDYEIHSSAVRQGADLLEIEEGLLYQGPLGSFQEDSPPRDKGKHTREDTSTYRHQQPLDSLRPERSTHEPIEYSANTGHEHSPTHYNQRPFDTFGSPAYHNYKGYGYHQSRYHHDASPSYNDPSLGMTSPRIDTRNSGVGGFGSPNMSMDFGSPPGITFSDSFGEGDTSITNNARIAFAPPISQRSNDSSDSKSSDDRSPTKQRGNPFRFPVKQSGTPPSKPPAYQSSPNLSFGTLDTPMENHGDFSPVGQSFGGFTDDGNFHSHPLTMSRSHSEEDQSYQYNKPSRHTNLDRSPFSEFMDELTPSPNRNREVPNPSARLSDTSLHSLRELQGVRRSPVLSGNRSLPHESPHRKKVKSTTLSKKAAATATATPSEGEKPLRSLNIRPSPVAPSSEVKPRTLWQQPGGGTIRLTLGQSGSRVPLSAQQRSLDDINSLLRAPESSQRASGPGQPSSVIPPSAYDAYRHHSMPRTSYYHGIPASQQRHSLATPIRDHPYGYHSNLGGVSSHHPSMLYPHSAMSRSPPIRQSFQIGTPAAASYGKENVGQQPSRTGSSKDSKKGKCNCKKSKCLKLYCECFAARLYCNSCNCKDCHNLPEFENERDKAVKAAITKNRAAFEPRINEEHNLGCKCKRSQCLKKYCECFQARVLCSGRCKCTDCENHAESQKLIDVRRRMKDHKGAEYAMKINHEAWKKGSLSNSAPTLRTTSLAFFGHHPSHPMGPLIHSVPHMHPHPSNPHYARTPYIGPSSMGTIFSPMNVNPVTPALGKRLGMYDDSPRKSKTSSAIKPEKLDGKRLSPMENKRPSREITPSSIATKSPLTKIEKEASPTKRKKTSTSIAQEETFPYFGSANAHLSKKTVLDILSYASTADKKSASQVSKMWHDITKAIELQ